MRDIILVIIVYGSIPLILRRPWIGILMFSWISYMNPHKLAWGFSQNMPFAAVLAVATLLGLLFDKSKKPVPLSPLVVVWVLLILHFSVTTAFSQYPAEAVPQLVQVLKIQLMAFATIMLIRQPARLDALVWVIALSIGFFGIKGGIFSLTSGLQFTVWGPPGGFIEGNNEIALALIVILPLMRYLQIVSDNKWIKNALLVSMLLCGISIIGSYSRGAFLAGSVMALTLIWQSRQRMAILSVLAVGALLIAPLIPDKWSNRMSSIQTYQEDRSALGRINAWYFAYNLAKDHPFVGGGFDTFSEEMFAKYAPDPEDFHDSHSIYFGVLAEHGFVGLGLFLTLGGSALIVTGAVKRRTKKQKELQWAFDLASMVRVSLIGYAVGGMFLGLQYFDLYYHLIAITVLLQVMVSQQLRQLNPSIAAQQRQENMPGNNSSLARRARDPTGHE